MRQMRWSTVCRRRSTRRALRTRSWWWCRLSTAACAAAGAASSRTTATSAARRTWRRTSRTSAPADVTAVSRWPACSPLPLRVRQMSPRSSMSRTAATKVSVVANRSVNSSCMVSWLSHCLSRCACAVKVKYVSHTLQEHLSQTYEVKWAELSRWS